MAGNYDNTDNIDVGFTTSDTVKVSKSALQFGPLRFYRGNAVPPSSFGRNGDLFLLDDTARPLESLASQVEPTTVGVYQKVPAAIPVGPVVYDTPPGGAEFPLGGDFEINGTLVTINPGDNLAAVAAAIGAATAGDPSPVTAVANPTVLTGVVGGTSTPGDVLDIQVGAAAPVPVALNAPNTAAQAAIDINAAAIPGLTASAASGALVLTQADGAPVTLTDNTGTPTATLGPFTTTGGNLTITETVGDAGLTFTNINGDAANLGPLVNQPPSATTPGGNWTALGGGGVSAVLAAGVDSGVTPVTALNFIGTTVGGNPITVTTVPNATTGQVDITIGEPPPFASNFNANNGSSGNQSVSEAALGIVDTYISNPTAPGVPFADDMSGTVDRASNNGTWTFTTPGNVTGFGGDSTMTVEVLDGLGAVIYTGTTAALTGNGAFPAGANATVTLSGYAVDSGGPEALANVDIDVDMSVILAAGGPAAVRITHSVNSASSNATSTAGSPWVYNQQAGAGNVFYDPGPTPPTITGAVTIAENTPTTKFLSGVEYYTTGSTFDVNIPDIDDLNNLTHATIANGGAVRLSGTEYGLPAQTRSAFGPGNQAAEFGSPADTFDVNNIVYDRTAWTISAVNHRFVGPTGNIDARVADAWGQSAISATANANIAVDTFGTTSTDLAEFFNDEARRLEADFVTPWNSNTDLGAVANPPHGLVYNGQLWVPNAAAYTEGSGGLGGDFTSTNPNPGTQPDYSGIGVPVHYYRTFVDGVGGRASATFTFSGTFAAGDALADLVAGNLEVYVRRVASGTGNSGPVAGPSTDTGVGGNPGNGQLRLHYPLGAYDDGATEAGGGIRLGSSAGNTINVSFGGDNADGGLHVEIKILNAGTRIDGVVLSF